jgi:hypothetical protein
VVGSAVVRRGGPTTRSAAARAMAPFMLAGPTRCSGASASVGTSQMCETLHLRTLTKALLAIASGACITVLLQLCVHTAVYAYPAGIVLNLVSTQSTADAR